MRSDFSPKNMRRAKGTLERQLKLVQREAAETKEESFQERDQKRTLWKKISGFFGKFL